jgi:hypothetical protein
VYEHLTKPERVLKILKLGHLLETRKKAWSIWLHCTSMDDLVFRVSFTSARHPHWALLGSRCELITEEVPGAESEAPDYPDHQNRTLHVLRYMPLHPINSRPYTASPIPSSQKTGHSAVALRSDCCRQLELGLGLGFCRHSLQLVINDAISSSSTQPTRS